VAVQRDFVKETVDVFLNESAKLLQLSSRVANDAVSPINERVGDGQRQRQGQQSGQQSGQSRGRQEQQGGQSFRDQQQSRGQGREMRH
jgi:hypothetical protein